MKYDHVPSSWRRLLAFLLLLAVIATACGGDGDAESGGDASPGTSASDDAEIDPEGVLRLTGSVVMTGNSATQFDPSKLISPAEIVHGMIYDYLLRPQMDGTFEPGLAKSAEVVDPSTITIELQEGITFSDGAPFDAEAVRAGIQRNVDADNPGALATELDQVASITVDGPLALTIRLKSPIAGTFYNLLGRGETMIVSPKAVAEGVDLDKEPVGAGPFTLDRIEPERMLRLVKNPDYFQADDIKIAAVEYVHTPSAEAIQNALLGGSADLADRITPDIVRALEGSDIEVQQESTSSTLFWAQICKSRPPLDNVKVRQALNYGLDRDQLNQVLYDGESEPMWGFWPEDSKFHDDELTGFYERDVEKAKKLLAEAGYPDGFEIDLLTTPALPLGIIGTELVQAQWKEIGVDVNIAQTNDLVTEFFVENKYPALFFPLQRTGLDRVTRNLVPGSIGNICNWDHPELNALVEQIRAEAQDSEEAIALWKKLDRLALEEAMNIFGVFGTNASAWDGDRLGGVRFVPNYAGVPYVDVRSVFVKA